MNYYIDFNVALYTYHIRVLITKILCNVLLLLFFHICSRVNVFIYNNVCTDINLLVSLLYDVCFNYASRDLHGS